MKATYTGARQGSASELDLEINGVDDTSNEVMCMLMDEHGQYDQLTGRIAAALPRACSTSHVQDQEQNNGTVVNDYVLRKSPPAAYWKFS